MLCQDGCVDCEPCATQRNPLFKWVLRRVRRLPLSDPPRHDLQLTVMPQADDRLHASNLGPNFHVYVTSQEEARTLFPVIQTQRYDNDRDPSPDLESSFSAQHHRSTNLWRLAERDSTIGQDRNNSQQDDRVSLSGNASTGKPGRGDSTEQNHSTRRRRPRPRPAEKPVTSRPTVRSSADVTQNDVEETVNQLVPRLILGTDQKGQKQLIHVVPADQPPASASAAKHHALDRPISSQLIEDRATHSNKTKREKQTYQQLFRRVFDSLNTHRRSIERFLESSTDDADDRGTSATADNMEVAGFSWNNREARHASVDLGAARLNEAPSWSLYVGDDNRKYQQYRSRHDHEGTQQNFNNYYSGHRDANSAKISRNRQSMDLYSIGREGREIRVKPYSVNITRQDIPEIDLSVLSQSSDNSSMDAISKPGSSGFVTNSVKQIDLNDMSVHKAFVSGNDSIEASSITIDRENRQLFNPERLKSSDANREVRASHHPFRIIVTTEPSATRREHETPNRTKTLEITTSKALVGNP